MAVSKRLRYEILRRDNHACRYCGGAAPDVVLTVDHVIPVALGGSDDPGNLVTACRDCNAGKSTSSPDAPLVQDVSEDALRWAEAIKYAAAQSDADLTANAEYVRHFDVLWRTWTYGHDDQPLPRPENWGQSVLAFRDAGLSGLMVRDAFETAMHSRVAADQTWRYFCGVCWRKVDQMRDRAASYMQEGI